MLTTMTREQAADAGMIDHIIDGDRGIYIPQHFTKCFAWYEGVEREDIAICERGPDEPHYWDAWQNVLDSAYWVDADGKEWRLWQDDSVYMIRDDVEITDM